MNEKLTPEQRENREVIVEAILHPYMHKASAEHLAEEIVEALTAPHTEPEDERKRFPKGKPSSMEDIFMEYPHTEPENLTLDVDKGDKTPRNGADCQAHTEPEDECMVRVAPFLARLIEPRYDSDETNDYICNSTDCENALRAYKDWLQQEDKDE